MSVAQSSILEDGSLNPPDHLPIYICINTLVLQSLHIGEIRKRRISLSSIMAHDEITASHTSLKHRFPNNDSLQDTTTGEVSVMHGNHIF